jgi:hypothetical protein
MHFLAALSRYLIESQRPLVSNVSFTCVIHVLLICTTGCQVPDIRLFEQLRALRAANSLVIFVLDLMAKMFTAALFANIGAVFAFGVLLVWKFGELVLGHIVGTYDALLACHLLLGWYFIEIVILLFGFAFPAAPCACPGCIAILGWC